MITASVADYLARQPEVAPVLATAEAALEGATAAESERRERLAGALDRAIEALADAAYAAPDADHGAVAVVRLSAAADALAAFAEALA